MKTIDNKQKMKVKIICLKTEISYVLYNQIKDSFNVTILVRSLNFKLCWT